MYVYDVRFYSIVIKQYAPCICMLNFTMHIGYLCLVLLMGCTGYHGDRRLRADVSCTMLPIRPRDTQIGERNSEHDVVAAGRTKEVEPTSHEAAALGQPQRS